MLAIRLICICASVFVYVHMCVCMRIYVYARVCICLGTYVCIYSLQVEKYIYRGKFCTFMDMSENASEMFHYIYVRFYTPNDTSS